jgi:hypothetical protein
MNHPSEPPKRSLTEMQSELLRQCLYALLGGAIGSLLVLTALWCIGALL